MLRMFVEIAARRKPNELFSVSEPVCW